MSPRKSGVVWIEFLLGNFAIVGRKAVNRWRWLSSMLSIIVYVFHGIFSNFLENLWQNMKEEHQRMMGIEKSKIFTVFTLACLCSEDALIRMFSKTMWMVQMRTGIYMFDETVFAIASAKTAQHMTKVRPSWQSYTNSKPNRATFCLHWAKLFLCVFKNCVESKFY